MINTIQTILAIETSCDETAAAVVRDGHTIIANVVASQIDIHRRYGGVVPEVASRQHILSIEQVVRDVIAQTPGGWRDIDAVAATYGPGLSGALLTGLNTAKTLAWARGLPFIAVNHVEAHVYAAWLGNPTPPVFPCVALIVSGGHTLLALLRGHGHAERLGGTRDDAAGEAFDKVARLLKLGFPGGPAIQRLAQAPAGNERMPRAWLHGSYDFSFSGLKTAVLHEMQAATATYGADSAALTQRTHELAYLFQESVVDILTRKTRQAVLDTGAQAVVLAGGVAANQRLREVLVRRVPVPVHIPDFAFCTDNAAMIAACAYYRPQLAEWSVAVDPNLAFV
jgi:N6-L-threonylcarbamoyladenine synthase